MRRHNADILWTIGCQLETLNSGDLLVPDREGLQGVPRRNGIDLVTVVKFLNDGALLTMGSIRDETNIAVIIASPIRGVHDHQLMILSVTEVRFHRVDPGTGMLRMMGSLKEVVGVVRWTIQVQALNSVGTMNLIGAVRLHLFSTTIPAWEEIGWFLRTISGCVKVRRKWIPFQRGHG